MTERSDRSVDKVGAVGSLRDLRHQATVQGYRIGWWAVRRMPARITRRAFDLAADQSWRANGAGVRRLTDNLARVCPEAGAEQLRELTRAGMRSYLRYWQEAFRLPAYDRDELLRSVHVVHGERLIAAIGSGRGMVAALPHMGNWDLAGAWMTASQDCELVSVAEQLEPVEVYEEFLAYRRGIRIEVLPAGSAETYRALESAVRRGAIVALVADRDLSRRGVPVDFFGARTRMPAGPALLAARTGAPLYPVISSYDGPTTMRLVVGDPIEVASARRADVVTATQAVADAFAAGIAAHPQDWHMLQRLWPDDVGRSEGGDLGAVRTGS